ncbi:hypothetical protein TRICI_004898 [Trichomonascus ciferrii]|uniref:26S proteasome complex subunit SEM1 n=1 Tax=Trichomonascus ciferrii TaxID=44093 RepID=A0A642V022_9ASCO|nr:hypothetical protein TRICI_004898 [Trichomonascus ciferrii]
MAENTEKTTEDKVTATLVSLEEDDEFEDFPVENWTDGDTNVADSNAQHLWEEQWDDDDDTDENFSAQLK